MICWIEAGAAGAGAGQGPVPGGRWCLRGRCRRRGRWGRRRRRRGRWRRGRGRGIARPLVLKALTVHPGRRLRARDRVPDGVAGVALRGLGERRGKELEEARRTARIGRVGVVARLAQRHGKAPVDRSLPLGRERGRDDLLDRRRRRRRRRCRDGRRGGRRPRCGRRGRGGSRRWRGLRRARRRLGRGRRGLGLRGRLGGTSCSLGSSPGRSLGRRGALGGELLLLSHDLHLRLAQRHLPRHLQLLGGADLSRRYRGGSLDRGRVNGLHEPAGQVGRGSCRGQNHNAPENGKHELLLHPHPRGRRTSRRQVGDVEGATQGCEEGAT